MKLPYHVVPNRPDHLRYIDFVRQAHAWCSANFGPEGPDWTFQKDGFHFKDVHRASLFKLMFG